MQRFKSPPRPSLSALVARCLMPSIEVALVQRLRAGAATRLAKLWSATAGPLPSEKTPRILLEVLPDGKVWMRGFVGTHADCSYIARADAALVGHDLPRLISELRDQVFDKPKSASTE